MPHPHKYALILWSLPDDELFSPALIADRAVALGLVETTGVPEQDKLARHRVRIAMGRLSNNKFFKGEGHGMVIIPGQSPIPAWKGWRWKKEAEPLDDKAFARLVVALASLPDRQRVALLRQVRRRQ